MQVKYVKMTNKEYYNRYGDDLTKGKELINTIWQLQTQPIKVIKQAVIKKPRAKYSKDLPPNYKSYLGRANKRKFPFEFTVQEFLEFIAQDCYYCGKVEANGIDRIDSKVGYLKANSVPCCGMCNIMKYTFSTNIFLNHIQKIFNFQGKK